METLHVLISSSTGPLIAGLVDYPSLGALQDAINGADRPRAGGPARGYEPLRCLAVADPTTGAVTLVTLTGGPCTISER